MTRVVAITASFYVVIFVVLRVAGRRTLAQISAFDFLVTVAIGSLFANTALSSTSSLAQGAAAVITLVILQIIVAHLRQRFPRTRRVLDFSPRVIVRDGRVDTSEALWGPQLTEDEIMSMLRQQGIFDLDSVRVIILEPTGGLSLIRNEANDNHR